MKKNKKLKIKVESDNYIFKIDSNNKYILSIRFTLGSD